MTRDHIRLILIQNGIWRAKVEESIDYPRDLGRVRLYVPRTCLSKARSLVKRAFPVVLAVEIRELKNPLRQKKHTCVFTTVDSFQ